MTTNSVALYLKQVNKIIMIIPFVVLFISIGYLCYQAKDEVYLIDEESLREKDELHRGLDDLYI